MTDAIEAGARALEAKRALVDEFLRELGVSANPERGAPYPEDFLPWLIRTGRAEAVDCHSWHVGSYDGFRP